MFQLGRDVQFAFDAFKIASDRYENDTATEFDLRFPIGLRPDGSVLIGKSKKYTKAEVLEQYTSLSNHAMPIASIYNLVTMTELWLAGIIRIVVRKFPKKLGENKQVPVGLLLSATDIDTAHRMIVDHLLNELAYKSPQEQAKYFESLTDVDLAAIPAFMRYLEVKATRDVYVHAGGIANETYCRKAGSHSRAKPGDYLVMGVPYFLSAYETCLQLLEQVEDELKNRWPPSSDPADAMFGREDKSAGTSGNA